MDKLRMTKGRLGVAVVFMALFAMFAMPAFASAATFTSQYPTATLVAAPAVVAVDVIGAPALKATTADITINGVSYPTFVKQAGASAGAWTSVVSGTPDAYGQYRSTWTWVGGANANATVYCYPPAAANANGAKAVVMSVKDSTGAAITTSWSYTVAVPAVVVNPPAGNGNVANSASCGSDAPCHADHKLGVHNNGSNFGTTCVGCHTPHGFDGKASGHSTASFGKFAHEKWDGSEGVVVKDSAENTITQEWPLPTASVFWSQSNRGSLSPTDAPAVAMAGRGIANPAAAVNTTVGWDSVVTCNDCHTGLVTGGPQGANAVNFGLDPNFPDDWTKAEITSFDPTGMRKIDTKRDTPNPYYTKLGSNVYMPTEVENAVDPANPWAGTSIESTTKPLFGTGGGGYLNGANLPGWSVDTSKTNITVKPGGFYGLTDQPSNGYSMGDSVGAFICQKCHKLTNSFQGLGIEGNGRGARDNNLNYMGMSNEAHMEHHNDMITGQGNCVSCHIAIPHGWKRPRLLVYESDPAPYKVQYVWPSYRSTDTATLRNMNPSDLLTAGNWGYLSNPTATTSSRYGDITATNPNTGGLNSTHLEKLDASAEALKELAVGPAEEFESYDAANTAAFSATGISVNWGGWQMTAKGVEWLGNPNGFTIPATYWDGATNSAISGSEAPIQNNCNACTSAGAGTHAPQNAGNTGGEGVKPSLPYWK